MRIIFNNFIESNVLIYFVLALLIFILLFNLLYKRYVINKSVTLSKLDDLNAKFSFHKIPSFDMKHSYDNENMYNEILPADYLIYELQFKQKQVKQALNDTKDNSSKYRIYISEYNKISSSRFIDSDVKFKFLFKLFEGSLIKRKKLQPVIEFNLNVVLILTKMNGEIKTWKSRRFTGKEIFDFIYCLNKKNGDFYLVPEIWQAICRVERGKVTNKMRFAIYDRDNHRCVRCGRKTKDLEIDHIYPISKGGKSTFDNLQTLCHKCNQKKADKIL